MKLIINEKTVKDLSGNVRWFIKRNSPWTFKLDFTITDVSRQRVVQFRGKKHFLGRFHLEEDGREVAEFVEEFTFSKARLHITGTNLRLDGTLYSREHTVFDGDAPIMYIEKPRDGLIYGEYRLDLENDQDELLAIGIVLVIDSCFRDVGVG